MGNKAINKGLNVTKLNETYHKGGENMASNIKAKDVVKGIFSAYAPVTVNSIDSARQVASDVKTIGRQINIGMRQNMKQIDKSQPGRRAIALFTAAKDALSNGSYEIEQANDEMYDDYEEYEQDFSVDNMTEEERANTSPEEVILRGNRGIAKSVIRASTAQLTGMKSSANKVLMGTLKGMEASTKSINATIIYSSNMINTQLGMANTKLDAINQNLVSLINYQNENTTTYYEKNLELMNSMIKSMENLNQMSQGKGARDLKNFNTRNGFNIKEYLNRVKKSIKGSTLVSGSSTLGSIYKMSMDNPDLMSPGETIGQLIPMVLDIIPGTNGITNKLGKLSKADKRVSQYMNEVLYRVGDKLSTNMLASILGLDALGNKRRRLSGPSMSNYMKEQLPWNGKAQKALTEVIPELLTSIDAGINSVDKRYFDYDEGNWKSRKELEKEYSDSFQNNIALEISQLTDKLGKILDNSAVTPEDAAVLKTELSNAIMDRIYGGDVKASRDSIVNVINRAHLSNDQAASLFNNLESGILSVTEGLADLNAKIGSSDSVLRNINNRSGATERQAIGKTAFQTNRENRRNVDLFETSYSQSVDDTMKFIERAMKNDFPDFKLTKEYQDGILTSIRAGESDFEILRKVKNTYGKSDVFKMVTETIKKKWAKLTGKQYVAPAPNMSDDDNESYGKYGDILNQYIIRGVYGVDFDNYWNSKATLENDRRNRKNAKARKAYNKQFTQDFKEGTDVSMAENPEDNLTKRGKRRLARTRNGRSRTVQPKKNEVGAASSRATEDSGKTAGAGTNAQSQAASEGKSSVPPIDRNVEEAKDNLVGAALDTFDDIMNANESDNQKNERDRAKGAEVVTKLGEKASPNFSSAISKLIDSTIITMGTMISSFTTFGSRLFGKDGLVTNFLQSKTFQTGLKKVKDYLFDEDNGVFKDQVKAFKDWGADMWGKTKDQLAKGYDWVYDKYSQYKYGDDYKNNADWQNSQLMQTLNLKAKRESKAAETLKNYNENGIATTLTLDDGRVVTFDGRNWKDEEGHYIRKRLIERAQGINNESSGTPTDKRVHLTHITKDGKTLTFDGNGWKDEEGKIVSKAVAEKATNNESVTQGKTSVPEIQKAAEETKSSIEKTGQETPEVLKESVQKVAEAGAESAKTLKESTESATETLVGNPKEKPEVTKKKYTNAFNETIKKHLPKIGAGAIAGAGIGMLNGFGGASLLGSLFLPTGIIGGAIVGGGLTLLSQTEAFKSMLFGKKGENGERSGGLISKELKEKFKKAAPIAVGGAVAGALKSIITSPITGGKGVGLLGMQLLPGGILGGAIMGMGVGLLKNSETFKSLLFGKKDENGKRTGTWLSKSYESMKKKMAGSGEGLKKMLKGGAIGAVAGATLAHMGAIPAALSMGGPVGMGIMGLGLGIASSTKRFNEVMFGVEEFDDNGNSLGRKGGILGRVKNLININVVEPISQTFKSAMLDMIDWTKEKITLPFRAAFGPILDSIKGIKDNVVDLVSDQFKAIGEGITSMIKNTLGKLFSPITRLIGGIGKAMIGSAKVGIKAAALPLTAGLSTMNFLTMGKRRKEYSKFYKEYYTNGGIMEALKGYWDAEQADYDEEAAATGKRAKKVGFFDKASDFLSAITGNGVIADAAREGYNKAQTDGGQNTFNWRDVTREKRELKQNRRKRHKAERQWRDISKLSQRIGDRDLGGREVTLTDSRFQKYKDKFTKLGVDGNLINTNEDLMELIYHPDKFRQRAAGDSGQNGMLQALRDFKLSPEEIEAMQKTEKYQSNVEKYLKGFSDKFEAIGEAVLFDRQLTSYKEDRSRDTKRLKRKLKRLRKSNSLWEGRKAINLNDPELYEYDIENLSDDDLNDYAASNFADNNDFKGYLASIGRKMSPDDTKMKFATAANGYDWKAVDDKKSAGKSSTENPNQEVVDELKKSNELAEVNTAINVGGQTNLDKVKDKAKSGTLDAKATSKFSIGGIFSNLFNRKNKADKKAAHDAKEAQESTEAQALGDKNEEPEKDAEVNVTVEGQEEKKQSIFSKIFGGIGKGLATAGAFIAGSTIGRAILKFGAIAIPTALGLTALELIKPGSADAIGAKLDAFNKSVDDGSFVETVKTKITDTIDWVKEKLKWFFDDTRVGKAMKTVGEKIGEHAPQLFDTVLKKLPTTLGTVAKAIADNVGVITDTAVSVVTTIAPPLLEAMIKSLPTLAIELGIKMPIDIGKSLLKSMLGSICNALGFPNPFKEDEDLKSQSNLSKSEAEDSNKNYQVDKSAKKEYLTQEQADQIEANGGTIRKDSNGLYEEKYVVPTSNIVGFDEEGNAQYQNTNGAGVALAKTGIQAAAGLAAGGTKLTKGLSIMGKVGSKLVKPAQFLINTGGKITSLFGKGLAKTVGNVPIIGTPTKIIGNVINGEGKLLSAAAHPIQAIMGTAEEPSIIAQGANLVKSAGQKVGNVISKITGKSTQIASEAASASADGVSGLFGKISKFITELKTNKTLLGIIDKFKSIIGKECKPLEWIADFLNTLVKKIYTGCLGKNGLTYANTKISQTLTKMANTSVPVITVVMAAYGVTSGAMEAENLFHVNEADNWMVAISAIMKGLFSISFGCILDLLFELASHFLNRDIKQEIAVGLYKLISKNSPERIDELMKSQDTQETEREVYNTLNNLNVDEKTYNDLDNKSVMSKLWTGTKNTWYRITGQTDKIDNGTKDTEAIVSALTKAGYSNEQIKAMNADELKSAYTKETGKSVGNGTGASVVGYGPGQSQGNSAWADMPIGRFSNGKISTMKTGGCGPTALSTIANMFGPGINPGTVGAYAARNGYITDGGANEDLFTKGAAGLGLAGAKVSGKSFDAALNSGMPMAISGKKSGPFTNAGHVVVAKGTDHNGNVNIIDPIDGNLKKYSKSDITSGMTNAWAYDKPVGYGLIDNLKNIAINGLSDDQKKIIVNNLGLVQNAISNVPQILENTLEGAFKIAAKAITSPIAVPIQLAVKSLGIIGKLIAGDTNDLTTEEINNSANTNTVLTKMSNSIRKAYSNSNLKVATSKVSSAIIKKNTTTTSNNSNILTKAWNWITGKSKKVGNGIGSVGYGYTNPFAGSHDLDNLYSTVNMSNGGTTASSITTNSSGLFMPVLSTPGVNSNLAKINNGQAGPVSYEYIYDQNYKQGMKLGLTSEQAAASANAQASATWKKTTGQDTPSKVTNTSGSSTVGIKYNTTTGQPESSDTSNTNDDYNDDSVVLTDDSSQTTSVWDQAKEALSKAPTTLGGLVNGFKQFGNVISALWGSIKGEGTFRDLLEGNSSGSSGGIFSGSGNYETYSGGEEQAAIWKYFRDKGYSKNAVAGIMGAWQNESSNKALCVEGEYLPKAKSIGVENILKDNASLDDYVENVLFPAYNNTPSLKGKIKKNTYKYGGHYYPGLGLAQWTGVRAYNLGSYAGQNNSDWRSLKTQLDFADKEINERNLKTTLNNRASTDAAVELFARKFEGGGYTGDGLTKRKKSAKEIMNTYANSGYGLGPVGFGPNGDGPSNWSEFMQGSQAMGSYLNQKLIDMGLGDLISGTNTNDSVTYDSSQWADNPSQNSLVSAMNSIRGKIKYSLSGPQDPDKGSASCASTVAWAYRKVLGSTDSSVNNMSASSTTQAKHPSFSTIWTNTGSGIPDSMMQNLRPGDILYQNWGQTRNNGSMDHTEMYAGNGQDLSHGGPGRGPVVKSLDDYRRKHTMMIRRYNGFLNSSNSGYGFGPDSKKDQYQIENNFRKEMNKQHNSRPNPHGEGEHTSGYGPDNSNEDLVTRLDKILTVIGEWYADSKKNKKEFGTITNNTSVVNNNSVTQAQKDATAKPVTTHIDKLAQRHQAYSRMYKTVT